MVPKCCYVRFGWKSANKNPEGYVLALSNFHRLGGCNAYYAHNMSGKENAYSLSGLLCYGQCPLKLLRNYPLHKAVALGQTAVVRRLVDSGHDINSLDINSEATPKRMTCQHA